MNIIQIGTCVGNDDLTNIVKDNKVNLLLLIEPMEIHNEAIRACYRDPENTKNIENIYLENVVIVPENRDNISFYYHEKDGPRYEVASIYKEHILKHGYPMEGLVELKVRCTTLNDLFEKYNLRLIDILFIDAEGADDSLIKSIDFDKYSIDKIYFENLHISNKGVYLFLENLGYTISHNVGLGGWSSLAMKKNICLNN